MAHQKDLYFVGKAGNQSYYSWKDIPCIRTIPAKVYQSSVVQANSKTTGTSTRMGASFRSMFSDVLPFPKSFEMQTRFRGALQKWLKYHPQSSQPPGKVLPYLDGFSFNEAALLHQILKAPLTLTLPQPGELVLQIPAFVPMQAITAPEDVTSIQLTVIAACCGIETALPMGKVEAVLTIPYDTIEQPAHNISLPLQMPVSSLTLVVVSLLFFTGGTGAANIVEERWLPVEVVGGVARVTY